ncbi:hypothetical protein Golob_014695 [Gossypium lobatum]|uniref:Uncharacterized protein n=1 Tax=Gossypium lobatum TaxID=34289 RepID=A0A7J8LYV8_9ROSI|nr:hypothetical protein [Gossypium lobatum]
MYFEDKLKYCTLERRYQLPVYRSLPKTRCIYDLVIEEGRDGARIWRREWLEGLLCIQSELDGEIESELLLRNLLRKGILWTRTLAYGAVDMVDTEGTEAHVRAAAWYVRTRGAAAALGFALRFQLLILHRWASRGCKLDPKLISAFIEVETRDTHILSFMRGVYHHFGGRTVAIGIANE